MKKRKTIVALLAMAAVLVFAFQSSLTASAAGNTYIIHYDAEADEPEWLYQSGSTWEESSENKVLSDLQQKIKDGDTILIEGKGGEIRLNAHLANVYFLNGSYALLFTNGIDECTLFSGSLASISGSITNAYVYDTAGVTFNNNVNTLQIIGTKDELLGTVNVAGGVTVAHVIGKDNGGVCYEYYNVAAGRLDIEDGEMKTDEKYYSTVASAATPQTTQPAQPAAQSGTSSSQSSEYDDVPKTGESSLVYWLLGIAVVCLAGRYALRKVS